MSPPNLVVDGYNRSTGDDAAAAVITAFVAATAPVTTGGTPCASRLLRTSAAAASTAAGASVSCAALAPVLSRLYALNLPESKYKQNYWRFFQESTGKRS